MFDVLERFMDAVVREWKRQCISVSTDGARNMTGRVQGLVIRIQEVCQDRLLRFWCGLHQLDLVMQRVFKPSLREQFYGKLTVLIGHLRRQANLIAEMRSTCPKVADVRWISMYSSTHWLMQNRARVQTHLDEKKPACAPDNVWWIFLHAIHAFADESRNVFISLQGLKTLVSQQRARLEGLIDTYFRMSGMQGPLSPDQIDDIVAVQPTETSGAFIITHEHVRSLLDGLGFWIIEQLDSLEEDDLCALIASVGKVFVKAADGISQISAERSEQNEPSTELPPVLPHELSCIVMRQFFKTLLSYRDRLLPYFVSQGIDDISKEFYQFLRAFREEPQFKQAVLNNSDGLVGFKDGWAAAQDRFPLLRKFYGGLASAFTNTATVESDFSIIGWEKDDTRMDLTDFSLEGILHSKQFMDLQKLSHELDQQPGGN